MKQIQYYLACNDMPVGTTKLHREFAFYMVNKKIGGIIIAESPPRMWQDVCRKIYQTIKTTLKNKISFNNPQDFLINLGNSIRIGLEQYASSLIDGQFIDAHLGLIMLTNNEIYTLQAGDIKVYLYYNKEHKRLWKGSRPASLRRAYNLNVYKTNFSKGCLLLAASTTSFTIQGLGGLASKIFGHNSNNHYNLEELSNIFLSPSKENGIGGSALFIYYE